MRKSDLLACCLCVIARERWGARSRQIVRAAPASVSTPPPPEETAPMLRRLRPPPPVETTTEPPPQPVPAAPLTCAGQTSRGTASASGAGGSRRTCAFPNLRRLRFHPNSPPKGPGKRPRPIRRRTLRQPKRICIKPMANSSMPLKKTSPKKSTAFSVRLTKLSLPMTGCAR